MPAGEATISDPWSLDLFERGRENVVVGGRNPSAA
jgi:hypothetical protein